MLTWPLQLHEVVELEELLLLEEVLVLELELLLLVVGEVPVALEWQPAEAS